MEGKKILGPLINISRTLYMERPRYIYGTIERSLVLEQLPLPPRHFGRDIAVINIQIWAAQARAQYA